MSWQENLLLIKNQIVMRKTFLIFSLWLMAVMNLYSQNIYQKYFGLVSGEEFVRQIIQTSDKGTAAIGYTNSSGKGKKDMFLAKFDMAGNLKWAKTYGGDGDEDGYSLQQTNDGGYILIGSTSSYGSGGDVFIVKTNASGSLVWSKAYGGSKEEIGRGIIELSDGSYMALAQTQSNSFGLWDVAALKISAVGDILWIKQYGGNQNELCYNLSKTSDNMFLMWGICYSFSVGKHDFLILKINENGNLGLGKVIGTSNEDFCYSAKEDPLGNFYLAGYTLNSLTGKDNVVIKTDNTFTISWQKVIKANKDDYFVNVLITDENGIFLPGNTFSYGSGDRDIFLSNFSADGQLNFFKVYGGSKDEMVPNNSSYLADYEKIMIGASTFSFHSDSFYDGYLVKTNFSGNSGCNEKTVNPDVQNANLFVNDILSFIGTKSVSWNSVNGGAEMPLDILVNQLCFTGIEKSGSDFMIDVSNPFDNNLMVNIHYPLPEDAEIMVYDLTGKMCFDKLIPGNFCGEISIESTSWQDGIYLVRIMSGQGTESFKIIKF